MIIFDNTFPDGFRPLPDGPVCAEPHVGTKLMFWGNPVQYSWWSRNPTWRLGQPGMNAGPADFVTVADAVYNHKPLIINAGGDNFTVLPPKAQSYLFQVDCESWANV